MPFSNWKFAFQNCFNLPKKPHGTSARNEVEVERIEIQRGTAPRRLKASIRFVGWVDLQSFGQVSSMLESTKGKGRSHLQ